MLKVSLASHILLIFLGQMTVQNAITKRTSLTYEI